eukprot:8303873-Ditylum_brightwellii.AAC.1
MGDNKNAMLHHDAGINNANSQEDIEDSTVNNNVFTPDKEEENSINHSSCDEEDSANLLTPEKSPRKSCLGPCFHHLIVVYLVMVLVVVNQ